MHFFLSVLLFLFFTANAAYSQIFNQERFRLSYEYRKKVDYITENGDRWTKAYTFDGENYGQIAVGYRFYKSFVAELGYYQDTYNLSWKIFEEDEGSFGTSFPIEKGSVFPFRISYEQRVFRLFKHPVYITPLLGYSLGFAQGVMLTDSASITLGNPITGTFATGTFKKGREYDLNKRFGFVEARLQAEFMVSKVFSFYAGAGFNFGTGIIGRTNVTAFSGGVPIRKIVNETRGDNRYFNIGIRLRIPNFLEKSKKDKT